MSSFRRGGGGGYTVFQSSSILNCQRTYKSTDWRNPVASTNDFKNVASLVAHLSAPFPRVQEDTDKGDEEEELKGEESTDGTIEEVGGVKKRKPVESKLDKRLQVYM